MSLPFDTFKSWCSAELSERDTSLTSCKYSRSSARSARSVPRSRTASAALTLPRFVALLM
jgi:hypothetical protein